MTSRSSAGLPAIVLRSPGTCYVLAWWYDQEYDQECIRYVDPGGTVREVRFETDWEALAFLDLNHVHPIVRDG